MNKIYTIVSSPANVFVADTRELAVQSAIAGSGIHAVNVPRTVVWPTLERFTNDTEKKSQNQISVSIRFLQRIKH
jgi:hypothetical protein